MWNRIVLSMTENFNSLRGHETTTFLIGIIVLIMVMCLLRYRSRRKWPPGPVGLPIFGYYLFLGKDPLRKLNEVAKKYGNVFSLYLGPQHVVVLNDWDSVREVLSQSTGVHRPPSLFENVPYNFGIIGANGPEWVQTRRLTSRAVKDIGLNSSGFEDIIEEEALELVQRIVREGGKPVEVRGFFSESFANNVLTLILGERLHAGHPLTKEVAEAVDAILEYSPSLGMMNFSPTLSMLLQKLGLEKDFLLSEKVKDFAQFVSKTVDERLLTPHTDEDSIIGRFQEVIQKQRKNQESSYVTEDSLKGNVIALLTGGGETTRSTVIWTLIAMAENPEKQTKIHEELDGVFGKEGPIRWGDRIKVPYTYATLMESMRWRTLAPFAMRIAPEDIQVQGYRIPKGAFILANSWSLHHDARYWDNPEEFRPERFLLEGGKKVNTSPDSYNPFSYGKRNCPGKLLGLMDSFQYFCILMQKFKVAPKDGSKVEHGTVLGLTFQATNVELRFIPR